MSANVAPGDDTVWIIIYFALLYYYSNSRLTVFFTNTDTKHVVSSRLKELDTKLERMASALDAHELTTNNQKLPATFRNPKIVSHSEELKSNAKAVMMGAGSISDMRIGSEAGGDNQPSSISVVPLDDTRTADIRQWIEQMSLSAYSATQSDATVNCRDEIDATGVPNFDKHELPDAIDAIDYNIAVGLFEKARYLETHGSASEAIRVYREAIKHGKTLGLGHKRLLRFDLKRLRAAYNLLRGEWL